MIERIGAELHLSQNRSTRGYSNERLATQESGKILIRLMTSDSSESAVEFRFTSFVERIR